jgi:hypothetical protein
MMLPQPLTHVFLPIREITMKFPLVSPPVLVAALLQSLGPYAGVELFLPIARAFWLYGHRTHPEVQS